LSDLPVAPDPEPTSEQAPGWWGGMKAWSAALYQEYGPAYLYTYLTLWVATWAGFWVAIEAGFHTEGVGEFGTLGFAWVLTKATQPARIGISAALVAPVVKLKRRFWP
jgi:hypothetical protein